MCLHGLEIFLWGLAKISPVCLEKFHKHRDFIWQQLVHMPATNGIWKVDEWNLEDWHSHQFPIHYTADQVLYMSRGKHRSQQLHPAALNFFYFERTIKR